MHERRNARRWRLSVAIVVGTLFALGSFWLLQVITRDEQGGAADSRANEPDYIVERFSFVRMSKTGRPAYIISGDRLTHRPLDDASDVEKPYVRSLAAQRPPMTMRAERAHIDQDNTRVQLAGKVQVERLASGAVQKMTLKTPALTVFPELDKMETDQPVEVVLGQSVMTGIGMAANNATRQIAIAHRLHIVYPPAPR